MTSEHGSQGPPPEWGSQMGSHVYPQGQTDEASQPVHVSCLSCGLWEKWGERKAIDQVPHAGECCIILQSWTDLLAIDR